MIVFDRVQRQQHGSDFGVVALWAVDLEAHLEPVEHLEKEKRERGVGGKGGDGGRGRICETIEN